MTKRLMAKQCFVSKGSLPRCRLPVTYRVALFVSLLSRGKQIATHRLDFESRVVAARFIHKTKPRLIAAKTKGPYARLGS